MRLHPERPEPEPLEAKAGAMTGVETVDNQVKFSCPTCHRKYLMKKSADALIGLTLRCRSCSRTIHFVIHNGLLVATVPDGEAQR